MRKQREEWARERFLRWLDSVRLGHGYPHDSALATAAGIDPSTISKWRSGKQRPTWESLGALARALNEDSTKLYRIAGLLEGEAPGKDQDEQLDLSTVPLADLLGELVDRVIALEERAGDEDPAEIHQRLEQLQAKRLKSAGVAARNRAS